jgi:hypothetical protein
MTLSSIPNLDYWRELGIEAEIGEGGVWVPDWAQAIEEWNWYRDPDRKRPVASINQLDKFFHGRYDLLRYLAANHADAAKAVYVAGGLLALVRFADETQRAEALKTKKTRKAANK